MLRSFLATALLATGLSLSAAHPALAQGQPLTAETMWELKRLSNPAVSPDGRHTLVQVSTSDKDKDRSRNRIWLFDNSDNSSRPLTAEDSDSSQAVWAPDSRSIAFVSRRGEDEAAQVYVISLDGGEARRVTSVPTGASAPKWFPDSRHVAFLSRVWADLDDWEAQGKRQKERSDAKTSAKTWDSAPVRHWDRWLDDRETHLYRVSVDGGEPEAITLPRGLALPAQDAGAGHYDIAPDGREVALVINTDESGVAPNPDIYVLPLDGGEPRNITPDNPAPDTGPRYSPDGRYLAYSQQQIVGFYADRARLMVKDRRAGSRRVVADEFDRSIGDPLWSADSRSITAAINDAGTVRLYRFDLGSGRESAITGDTSFGSPSMSRDGRVLVALNESFVLPPTLVRVDPRNGRATPMSTFNDELLATIDFGTYESVTYTGANGAQIQMWVSYPSGFDRSREYPLYLLLHGGPHNGITDGFHWRWNAQVFNTWGYVTAWHNFHGSSGFGQEFTDAITNDWATLPYEDTIRAAEWFAAQPWIDSERMAAGGGSYGGYLASLLLGREHPFQTLVAHAAVYNHYSQMAADFGATLRRFGEFWADGERFFRDTSPHYGAANFDTPTLVIHGELDYRVPVNHGVELFNTLQNRGVRSRFVYYPDENHWILKHNNSLHWYREKQAWLAEFIGGQAPEDPLPASANPVE
ncbi:prolyl oligopeptidase family serine peptidase [Alkalisalibacterium limincola]|nr:S9 family peptidase [Alkalisalibacterium limincola]